MLTPDKTDVTVCRDPDSNWGPIPLQGSALAN